MKSSKKKTLVTIDQISLSTGGFWTVIDIAESLKDKHEIAFCIVGLNYFHSIRAFTRIINKRIPQSSIFIYPFVKRKPRISFLSNILHLIVFTLYRLFLNIYFYKQRLHAINYMQTTNTVFFSSFLTIEDMEYLDTKFKSECIKIQNHAGSLDTLMNFSKSINDGIGTKKDSYFNYLR